jgi:XTP/dITP diphosphohydrolase
MRIIFASANPGKIREASEILGEGYEIVTPAEAGILEDIPETGNTLRENSLQKAMYIYERTGCDCFADDTGLEVDALGGAPGVHTARYGGPGRDFNANMDRLLRELGDTEDRKARFRTCVTLILGGETYYFDGVMEGSIARAKSGKGGFGYDPVFLPDGCDGLSAAEIGEEHKNAISHRGKALRAMAEFIKKS